MYIKIVKYTFFEEIWKISLISNLSKHYLINIVKNVYVKNLNLKKLKKLIMNSNYKLNGEKKLRYFT